MDLNLQNLLLRIIITLPFGIGAIVLFIIGIRRFGRFFMIDYQGNTKERFKDNFIGNVYMALGIASLISAIFSFQEAALNWSILPFSLCLGLLILPIGILGAYWRSFLTNKLWGGFMPIAREHYGYAQPDLTKQHKIDPSRIKISRRAIISAFLVALLTFFGLYFLLDLLGWNGSKLSGIIFRLFVSGLMAFSIFMTITSLSLSRRIRNLKDGKILDDDNDS